ncbi:MAG: response regulator [Bacteroidales bacterium]|nr:response regulator [Bacteroidales bacterium]
MKKGFLMTGLIFACLCTLAQSGDLSFRSFTTNQGLSNNWVRNIYQDDIGFIWFSTADGLNRFDGYEIKVFRLTDSGGQNLGDIHFNAVMKKNDHELWVCTDMGVYTFDFYKQEKFCQPLLEKTSVLCMAKDTDGHVWFGTNSGLYLYDPADSSLKVCIREGNSVLNDNYINTLLIDSGNTLWIGTKNGLSRLDRKDSVFRSIQSPGNQNILSGKDVMTICEDRDRQLWIGTAKDGLYILPDGRLESLRILPVVKGDISGLLADERNNLWIGIGGAKGLGILRLDTYIPGKEPEMTYYRNNPSDISSLSDNSVVCFLEDRMKDIWIGTLEGGINYTSRREKRFHSMKAGPAENRNTIRNNMVNAILDEERYLWIGTQGGLDRLDKQSGRFTHFGYESHNPGSIGANTVFSICRDSRGNLWAGTWSGGLNLFHENTGTFRRFVTGTGAGTISSNNVIAILEDSRGNLWVGTQGGGLNRYVYETGIFRRYIHNDTLPGSLYHESVNSILESSAGRLYVSTYFSIDIFDYEKEEFSHYIFNPSGSQTGGKIISLAEDSRKNIWVASNLGLMLFDEKASGSFVPYLTVKDIPNGTVFSILEDEHDNLWIGTDDGLCQIMKATLKPGSPDYRVFYSSDGLAGHEFIKRSAFKNDSGTMFFGSSGGFSWFHPDIISMNADVPPIVLTEFQLMYTQPDKKGRYTSIPRNINAIDKLNLSYRNSTFIIRFAALNYLHPEKNKYQYMLEGLDKEWIEADYQRTATYTHVPPGKYVFHVKGSNNDGIWNEIPKSVTITIRPPWWKTLAFRIFAILGSLVLLYGIFLFRIFYLRRQNVFLEEKVKERTNALSEANTLLEEKQEEIMTQNHELEIHRNHLEKLVEERTTELVQAKRKAEESDRLKSSFLANMSHEIRTPMNAIYGFSRLLHNDSLPVKERKHFLEIISNNCETLLVLINDILDISILEARKPTLAKDSLDIKACLTELENQFTVKNQKEIVFEFVNKNDKSNLYIINDKVRFSQVVTNLLNNAYKYTDSGRIRFGYEIQEGNILFFVSDTGIGIDPSHLEKIFDEFYKIEDNPDKFYGGTGIGLAICKKITGLMGGRIWAESEPEKGSVFYFSLPYVPAEVLEEKAIRHMVKVKSLPPDLTLIVAEDDPVNYELLRVILRPLEAKIEWARDGAEAIDFVKALPAGSKCIVLMDIRMPRVDGFKAARKIKKINPSLPIIAVTAYAQKTDRDNILKDSFDGYLSKPFKIENLFSLIMSAFSQDN